MRFKGSEITFSVLNVPVDYLCVIAAGFTAYALRFTTFAETIPVMYQLPMHDFTRIVLLASLMWIVVFAMLGLYAVGNISMPQKELLRVFIGSTTASSIFVFIIFFSQQLFASRFILLASWLLSIVFVIAGRIILRTIYRALLYYGIGSRSVVVLSSPHDESGLPESLHRHTEYGFKVVQVVTDWQQEARQVIEKLHADSNCDELIITSKDLSNGQLADIVAFCDERHITLRYVATILPIPLIHFGLLTLGSVPVIEVKRTRLEGWGRVWKRLFDILISAIALCVLSPLFLLVYCIVRLSSQGPGFVSLTRIGEKGKPFSLLKFRSMVVGAEKMKDELLPFNERKDGPLFKMTNDPRITPFGKLLRSTSVDELPQLWNVLKGDMSLVGPRPHEPQEVAQYTTSHKKLLTIKPGMTGLAQITGRSNLKFDQEAETDIFYIENWSLLRDLAILFKTPAAVFGRKNAV